MVARASMRLPLVVAVVAAVVEDLAVLLLNRSSTPSISRRVKHLLLLWEREAQEAQEVLLVLLAVKEVLAPIPPSRALLAGLCYRLQV